MAINQVINGSDRVVENPNRYKLNAVSGQANVYDLEKQPGAITNVGTPYNKLILDKIDNVLSYLTPSVEKTGTYNDITITQDIVPTSISQYWSDYNNFGQIDQTLTTYASYTPTIKYKGNRNFIASNNPTSSYISLMSVWSGSQRAQSDYFQLASSVKTKANNYTWFTFNDNTQNYEVIFDMIRKTKIKLNYNIVYSTEIISKIYGSNDNSSWVELSTISNNSDSVFESIEFYRYYKLRYESGGSNNSVRTYYMYISEVTYREEVYQNKLTFDNNTSFSNNQRLLVEMPSEIDMQSVVSNTINELACDTLLQPNNKYELIYKENTNKFELSSQDLIDITLTEAVNQVDLTGISDMLDETKLYVLIVNGVSSSGNSFSFGSGSVGFISSSSDTCFIIFKKYINSSNYAAIRCLAQTSSPTTSPNWIDSRIDSREWIKFSTASVKFNAGTRIIIKEVC